MNALGPPPALSNHVQEALLAAMGDRAFFALAAENQVCRAPRRDAITDRALVQKC